MDPDALPDYVDDVPIFSQALPRKYIGVKVFVRLIGETTLEGHIKRYAIGAFVELETEIHHELIPWTSILEIWIPKKAKKSG